MSYYSFQGTLVNTVTIIVGGLVGVFLGERFPARIKKTLMQGIGLAVIFIGIDMALEGSGDKMLVWIVSLLLGGVIGEAADLDGRLNNFGDRLEARIGGGKGSVSNAFVFATLVYVVGAMAITGSLQSGLFGDHRLLYTKAVLDGVTSVAFASTMGWGVMLSALPVLIYQGAIILLAGVLNTFLIAEMVVGISSIGGLMILAIGLNILEVVNIKVANFLPALIISPLLLWMIC